jgi:hypothetical protein
LAALDRDVARLDRPVAVLLTAPWHRRDAASIAERYGTTVWARPAAQTRLPFETQAGPLPAGIETFSAGGVWEGDVAFYIRPHRALVVAEFFMGINGGLRVCPSPMLQDRAGRAHTLRVGGETGTSVSAPQSSRPRGGSWPTPLRDVATIDHVGESLHRNPTPELARRRFPSWRCSSSLRSV